MTFFETFQGCSLQSAVSEKKTIKMIDHHSHLRDEWANVSIFMPVLVLITSLIHRSTLHFAVSHNIQVESVEHIEKHDIKDIEIFETAWT